MNNTTGKFDRVVEVSRNLSIILVSLIGATVLVRNHLLRPPAPSPEEVRQFALSRGQADAPPGAPVGAPATRQSRTDGPGSRGPAAGTQISLPGVDWDQSNETVVLALSDRCHFCTESAPFYQRLAREAAERKNVHLVAVFPQGVDAGKKYLADLGVPIEDVRQATLDTLGVRGTPTLVIVDKSGAVKQSWVGRLTADRESEVLSRIGA